MITIQLAVGSVLSCAFAGRDQGWLVGHWLPLLHIAAMYGWAWPKAGKSAEMVSLLLKSLLLKAGMDANTRDSVRLDGVVLVAGLSFLGLGSSMGRPPCLLAGIKRCMMGQQPSSLKQAQTLRLKIL